MFTVIINENFMDACAFIRWEDYAYPLTGWEREWSSHPTREEAEKELVKARLHVAKIAG